MSNEFRTVRVSDPRYESNGFRFITIKSNALKGRGDISVYIPGVVKGADSLPVIVMLHGVYGSHWSWAQSGGAHVQMENLIASGNIDPFVLIMPSDGLWGDGSGYIPHEGKDFGKWIGEEVPQVVIQEIGEISEDSPFFITGLSMGGYGAFTVGVRFPRFRGISGHSSITNLVELQEFVEEDWDAKRSALNNHKVIDQIMACTSLPPIRFDCGEDDPLINGNRLLHKQLTQNGIEHIYEEFDGAHSWDYWAEHVSKSYEFFHRIVH